MLCYFGFVCHNQKENGEISFFSYDSIWIQLIKKPANKCFVTQMSMEFKHREKKTRVFYV